MSRILVTGATGHIGFRLVLRLIEGGHKVIAIGKNSGQLFRLKELSPNVSTLFCDLSNYRKVSAVDIGCVDCLVHLAGYVPRIYLDDDIGENIQGNVVAMANVLEHFGNDTNKIYIASTVGVYGDTIDLPIGEHSYINPVTYYASSKYTAELYARIYAKENVKNCVVLRFSNVYGEGETIYRAIPNFIRSVLKGKPPIVNGDAIRDYTYLDDAVAAIVFSLGMQKSGIYNIASGTGSKVREIARKICDIDNKGLEPVFVDGDNSKRVYDITAARNDFGYEPKMEISEGIRREYEWLKQSIST